MALEIGRLVVKTAGRDAGKKAVIVDILDHKFVLLDGETRRRKCNIMHLEPINQSVKLPKNASHSEVAKVLKEIGIETLQTKPKPKTERAKKKRKTPEQLKVQKEEKKKLRDVFKPKKKESSLETKASETKHDHAHGHSHEGHDHAHEHKEAAKEEIKLKEKKPSTKKASKKE